MNTMQIGLSNIKLANSLETYLTKEKLFKITKVTNQGDTILTSFISQRPDILLLDSSLVTNEGYKIINLIYNLDIQDNSCKIYLFSNSPKNYKNTAVITSLKTPTTIENFKTVVKKIYTNSSKKTSNFQLDNITSQKQWNTVLFELGFSITNSGTLYFSYILSKYINSKTCAINMKNIYNDIAYNFNITSDKAKWSIEKSVKNMRKNQDISTLYKIIPNYDGREITAKYLLLMLLSTYS